VPSDAKGPHVVEVRFDAGPLGGKVLGVCPLDIAGE
jgi:hypothetical protein